MPQSSKSKSKKSQSLLFTTLASINKTDKDASQKRQQTITNSYTQSLASSYQCQINSILLELRVLTQRCLTEGGLAVHNDDNDDSDDGSGDVDVDGRVQQEVDALLENLLVARRELMGTDQLDDSGSSDEGSGGKSNNDDIDYAKLIQQQNYAKDVDVSSGSSSDDDNDDVTSLNNNNRDDIKSNNHLITTQIQKEYSSLRSQWKTILNKHHSNSVLHSGMSVNSSKFQSKAVDISFWEQVQGGIEHEMFKLRTTTAKGSGSQTLLHDGDDEDDDDKVGVEKMNQLLQFDDSKLYQQMLKDFISSSQSSVATTTGGDGSSSRTNKRGLTLDPATEAAQRLKRAMRKKTGSTADVDLTSLLTNDSNTGTAALDGTQVMMMMKNKKKSNTNNTVDRRASKGRKIRYTVNPKLVNFTFPIERAEPMIGNDVWFKSLFGGVGKLRK